MSRFIPLVLDNRTLADGEKASILAAYSLEPGEPLVELYAPPLPFRTSRLKTVLLWQVLELKFGVMVVVRSPFGPQAPASNPNVVLGSPVAAPVISITPFGSDYSASADLAVVWSDDLDPAEASMTNWPTVGDIGSPAPGFFSTFNSKSIPCWAFIIRNSGGDFEGEAIQFQISIDFSHSLT